MGYLINLFKAEQKINNIKSQGYDDTFDSVIDESFINSDRKEKS